MRHLLLSMLFLSVVPLAGMAQWQELRTSEDILIDQIGQPDSTDQYFDYFHYMQYGINGTLMIRADSDGNIEQANWVSVVLSDSTRDQVFRRIENVEDSVLTNPFNTFGEPGAFRIWLVPDFVVSLYVNSDTEITLLSVLREPYYGNFEDSEVIQDSFFSIGASVSPLDSEATLIVKVWKRFLELPPWSVDKFMLWRRYDPFLPAYFDVLQCPDYYSLGFHAKLVGIVTDPELHAYILSTVFSPVDSGDARFSPWKKTSRQITYVVRENDNWKITSALPFITRGWKIQRVGRILYRYPPNHTFNEKRALEAAHFLDSISTMFGINSHFLVHYYFAFNGSDVYRLLGLEVETGTTGILLDRKSTIIVCDTIENYLHELVHASLSPMPRPPVIDEGIAEFMANDTASDSIKLAAANEFIHRVKSVTIQNIWDLSTLDTADYLIYSAGLVFFQKVVERGGIKGVVAFYKASTSESEFEKAVQHYLNIKPKDIEKYWRDELKKAYQKLKLRSKM